MKIKEAIDQADRQQQNNIPQELKVKWLSTLDTLIFKKIISTHEDAEVTSFSGYDEDTDLFTTDLLVGEPWEDMYIHCLRYHYYRENNEYDNYNNKVAEFAAAYDEYARDYNGTHMPLQPAEMRYF